MAARFAAADRVAVVGSFDTKGEELGFLAAEIRRAGAAVLTVDASLRGAGEPGTDIGAERLARLAGSSREAIAAAPRGEAVELLGAGLAALGRELLEGGEASAFVGAGGGTAAALFGHLARTLPLGVPKLLVSTVAAGTPSRFVGLSDTFVLYPVADVEGLNSLTRSALAQAARAAAGLAGHRPAAAGEAPPPAVAATMFGVTTPCVSACRRLLEREGSEVVVFHATGAGGRSYEQLLGAGRFASALDLTLTEIADEVVGGILPAGPERLTAAARLGTPQVVVPGAVDVVNFAAPASVPERFAERTLVAHNPQVTLLRSDVEESRRIGATIGERLAQARAQATVVLPRGGVSALDVEGGPFWSPAADEALFAAIRASVPAQVSVVESEHHINDPAFAALVVQALRDRIGAAGSDRENTREGARA